MFLFLFVKVLPQLFRNEMKNFTSPSSKSILENEVTLDSIAEFSWDCHIEQCAIHSPVMMACLKGATTNIQKQVYYYSMLRFSKNYAY